MCLFSDCYVVNDYYDDDVNLFNMMIDNNDSNYN